MNLGAFFHNKFDDLKKLSNYTFFPVFFANNDHKQLLAKEWEKFLPVTFYYDHLPERQISEINLKIADFYFKETSLDVENEKNLTKVKENAF